MGLEGICATQLEPGQGRKRMTCEGGIHARWAGLVTCEPETVAFNAKDRTMISDGERLCG